MKQKLAENFEQAIAELELIVQQIEGNDVALEVALDKYQQGMALVKFCQDKLAEVEQKVKILDPDTNTLKNLGIE